MLKEFAFAIQSPKGLILWTTISVRKRTTIDKFVGIVKSKWEKYYRDGYRVIRVGAWTQKKK